MEDFGRDLARVLFIVFCAAFGATLAVWEFHVLMSLVFDLPEWVAIGGQWARWVIWSAGSVFGFVVAAVAFSLRS